MKNKRKILNNIKNIISNIPNTKINNYMELENFSGYIIKLKRNIIYKSYKNQLKE